MKNLLFYGPRVLATVVFIVLLSFLGVGNPKVVPILALFFTLVFALVFFLNKMAKDSERAAKSGSALLPIMQIIGLVVFIGVLSILGFIHGIVGYLVWFVVVSIVCGGIYMMIRNHQRHFELVPTKPRAKQILATVLTLIAIALPTLMILSGDVLPMTNGVGFMAILLTILGVILFILMMGFAIIMINKWGAKSMYLFLGYALIVVAAMLPGILVMLINSTSIAFAGAYMAALLALVFSFFALDISIKVS